MEVVEVGEDGVEAVVEGGGERLPRTRWPSLLPTLFRRYLCLLDFYLNLKSNKKAEYQLW